MFKNKEFSRFILCSVVSGIIAFLLFMVYTQTATTSSAQVPAVNSGTATWPTSGTMAAPFSGTTGSIGGGLLLAGACTTGTVSVPGSTTAMGVIASPTTYPGNSIVWDGYVSTNGTVTVRACALLALVPTASTYNVRVVN